MGGLTLIVEYLKPTNPFTHVEEPWKNMEALEARRNAFFRFRKFSDLTLYTF